MPLLAWLRSFTHTLPHVTSRSGWCQADSARSPIVLTRASMVSQPSVLYFRRIQRPSYHHPGSSSLSRRSISSSDRTGSFFSSAIAHLLWHPRSVDWKGIGPEPSAHHHAAVHEERLAGDER